MILITTVVVSSVSGAVAVIQHEDWPPASFPPCSAQVTLTPSGGRPHPLRSPPPPSRGWVAVSLLGFPGATVFLHVKSYRILREAFPHFSGFLSCETSLTPIQFLKLRLRNTQHCKTDQGACFGHCQLESWTVSLWLENRFLQIQVFREHGSLQALCACSNIQEIVAEADESSNT